VGEQSDKNITGHSWANVLALYLPYGTAQL